MHAALFQPAVWATNWATNPHSGPVLQKAYGVIPAGSRWSRQLLRVAAYMKCMTTKNAPTDRKLLTQELLAEHLLVSVRTLEEWRLLHKGPAFIKLGHLVRYDLHDVDTWLDASRTND